MRYQAKLIAARGRSTGFTLISTLVGLAVGLISIAAMLTLYRNLVTEARSINEQSLRDGQVATSSLAAQEEIQQAGFGIAGAAVGTDLVVLSNATLTTDSKLKGTALTSYSAAANGNAVIWGFNPTAATGTIDPAGYMCEGLIVTADGLQLLPPTSCKSAANWQSVTWKPQQLAPTKSLGPLSMFQANAGSCWPYQQQTTSGSSLQLSYYLPTQQQANSGQTNLPGSSGDSSSGSSNSGDGSQHSDNGQGNDYGADKGNGNGGSGSSGSSGGSSGSSGSSGDNPAGSSTSATSTSSAVTNVPTFSVCLPNFQQQGTN
ncbi:PilW family protein [Dyella nitratireducens]|uniref:Tfp pilus assembly protein PilX n=1 Tax=Dyella nitratireducens TaxID=1849580 RepID=A0ABQ1GHT0_9GAMM|nr:hypothetical protein [Dyella nitratireducens]GGA44093.1 hypothetical protein GCM10010981_36550 [Dyella nitratireducens]GLQ41788.1 hypothetical protein GCM10007902_16380 [Dyella nitratireducens]